MGGFYMKANVSFDQFPEIQEATKCLNEISQDLNSKKELLSKTENDLRKFGFHQSAVDAAVDTLLNGKNSKESVTRERLQELTQEIRVYSVAETKQVKRIQDLKVMGQSRTVKSGRKDPKVFSASLQV